MSIAGGLNVSHRQNRRRLGYRSESDEVPKSYARQQEPEGRRTAVFNAPRRKQFPGDRKININDDDNLLQHKEMVLEHTPIVQCPFAKVVKMEEKRFKIIREDVIGQGSFGEVYSGRRVGGTEKLAIKVYKAFPPPANFREFQLDMRDVETQENARKALVESLHEIMVMRAVSGHPYFVRYDESYIMNDHINIVMKLEDGNLQDQLDVAYPKGMPENKARRWFKQIVEGIDYMHRIGIVHMDLHSFNILIRRLHDGSTMVKISDFGQSRFLLPLAEKMTGQPDLGRNQFTTIVQTEARVKHLRHVLRHHVDLKSINLDYDARPVDVQSLGKLLLLLLGTDETELTRTSNRIGKFQNKEQMRISWIQMTAGTAMTNQAKDILWEMLRQRPNERITTERLLTPKPHDSKWLLYPSEEPGYQSTEVLSSMSKEESE